MALLSTSFFQVIFKDISSLANTDFSKIRPYLRSKLLLLIIIGLPPLIIFSFWSEQLFVLIFGEEWFSAGTFAKYLSWAAYIKFCINPLMAIFNTNGLVKYGTYWQILYFCTLTFTMLMLYLNEASILLFLKVFVVHEILLSLCCLFLIAFITSRNYSEKKV